MKIYSYMSLMVSHYVQLSGSSIRCSWTTTLFTMPRPIFILSVTQNALYYNYNMMIEFILFIFQLISFSTIDSSIDTHWTDLTDSRPGRFLLLIGFVLVLVLG